MTELFTITPVAEEAAQCNDMHTLRQYATRCTHCHLRPDVTQVVFGTGKVDADLMLIGEAS